jgi:hypothetical protein
MKLEYIACNIAGRKTVSCNIKIYKVIKEMSQVIQDLIVQCNSKYNWITKKIIK